MEIYVAPRLQARSTNLTVSIDDAPCAEYQWFFKDLEIPGATGRTYTVSDMDETKAGTYFAAVHNSFGGTISSNFVVDFVPDVEFPAVISAIADAWNPRVVRIIFSET